MDKVTVLLLRYFGVTFNIFSFHFILRRRHSHIAVICVTKSRTGNYDFRACARARGVSPVVQCSVGHIRFAVCGERSRDNSLRFLRKFHPDKI